ncbi:Acetylcholinesterase [Halotydeus destructor]|nr:Acetylcholinesterase [Halotydeus destructor]
MMTSQRFLSTLLISLTLKSVCTTDFVDVKTKKGVIRGRVIQVVGQSVNEFAGIPFAKPPLGKLRFARPVAPSAWTGILDTTKYVQRNCWENKQNRLLSEDCLYLSVWAPVRNETDLLPVFMYINGGSFKLQTDTYDDYNASYVVRYGVVNVFANFRDNVFGFFKSETSEAPGNQGTWDLAMTISWITENIEAFGGDPKRLTLSGVSSGGSSVWILALSPVTQPFIRNVMLMSASISGNVAKDVVDASKTLATSLGCNTTKNYVSCLRRLEAKKIFTAWVNLSSNDFQPFHGDEIFPYPLMAATRQGRFNKSVPLFSGGHPLEYFPAIGTECPLITDYVPSSNYSLTRDDVEECLETMLPNSVVNETLNYYLQDVNQSNSQALQVVMMQAYGQYYFTCPTYFASRIIAEKDGSSGVFSYYLPYGTEQTTSYCTDLTWPRPCHAEETLAMFGATYREPTLYNTTDRTYTDEIANVWTTFARTGQPPTMNGKKWPAYQDVPLAPILPSNLGSDGRSVYPNYIEINPLTTKRVPVYKPYKNCDKFWSKHMDLFDAPVADLS